MKIKRGWYELKLAAIRSIVDRNGNNGISQRNLAEKAGITQPRLCMLMSHEGKVHEKTVALVAKACGVKEWQRIARFLGEKAA